jgi:pimeloyl-ACP methyl ester carboxylesterase
VPTYRHDDLMLHYDLSGTGPPVLCVHGASGTAGYEWAALAAGLSDRYRCVAPDLRGHGRSDDRRGDVGIEQVHGDLLTLIAHEELGRPHLIGFSFGSEVALALELEHPGTAASLVLLSPGLANPSDHVPTREQLERLWPRALRSLHDERHGRQHWLELIVELCERSARRPKTDLDAVARISCPMLLIVGRHDDPRRIRAARRIADAHPGTAVVILEDARHAVHKEQPEHVIAAIRTFLHGIPTD